MVRGRRGPSRGVKFLRESRESSSDLGAIPGVFVRAQQKRPVQGADLLGSPAAAVYPGIGWSNGWRLIKGEIQSSFDCA